MAGYPQGKITHQWDSVVDLDLFHGGKFDLLQLSHWSCRLHCVLLGKGGGSELGTWPSVEGNWLEAPDHLQSSEIPLPSAPPSTSCLERHLEKEKGPRQCLLRYQGRREAKNRRISGEEVTIWKQCDHHKLAWRLACLQHRVRPVSSPESLTLMHIYSEIAPFPLQPGALVFHPRKMEFVS